MTNEHAINWLLNIKDHITFGENDTYDALRIEAIDLAIKALHDLDATIVEETGTPYINKCRDIALEMNLPVYFIYYEETGIFEVYTTATNELFEKWHCSKHLSNFEFNEIVTRYLDSYPALIFAPQHQGDDKE